MNDRLRIGLLATAASTAMVIAGAAQADPTDYIAIPTAEILKPGHYSLELGGTVEYFDADRDEDAFFLTEFGITERIEAGLDVNNIGVGADDDVLEDDGDLYVEGDIKYQFLDPSKNTWGLATGVTGVGGEEVDTFYYVTATRNIGEGSVTAGAGSDGDVTAFFGAAYPFTDRFTGIAEFFTDESGFALVGGGYKLTDHFSFAAWYVDPNGPEAEFAQVDLVYSNSF